MRVVVVSGWPDYYTWEVILKEKLKTREKICCKNLFKKTSCQLTTYANEKIFLANFRIFYKGLHRFFSINDKNDTFLGFKANLLEIKQRVQRGMHNISIMAAKSVIL